LASLSLLMISFFSLSIPFIVWAIDYSWPYIFFPLAYYFWNCCCWLNIYWLMLLNLFSFYWASFKRLSICLWYCAISCSNFTIYLYTYRTFSACDFSWFFMLFNIYTCFFISPKDNFWTSFSFFSLEIWCFFVYVGFFSY